MWWRRHGSASGARPRVRFEHLHSRRPSHSHSSSVVCRRKKGKGQPAPGTAKQTLYVPTRGASGRSALVLVSTQNTQRAPQPSLLKSHLKRYEPPQFEQKPRHFRAAHLRNSPAAGRRAGDPLAEPRPEPRPCLFLYSTTPLHPHAPHRHRVSFGLRSRLRPLIDSPSWWPHGLSFHAGCTSVFFCLSAAFFCGFLHGSTAPYPEDRAPPPPPPPPPDLPLVDATLRSRLAIF